MSVDAYHDLPRWGSVLAVVAHPDDESFGLGAVLAALSDAGAGVAVLCLTHGEASTLRGVAGDLHHVRAHELAAAGETLGVRTTVLRGYADGELASVCRTELVGEVMDVARAIDADGLVVFDPSGVTGHRDHTAATAAALATADLLDLPVLGWTLPAAVAGTLNAERGTTFSGHAADDIDHVVKVDRTRQRAAAVAHASQALPTSVLWRRLDLLGDTEYLRDLRPERSERARPAVRRQAGMGGQHMSTMTVQHLVGDRFAIAVRDHTLTVDQPVADGGDDTAPTPTELFVASLASCVAFYARRYLARHGLPTEGLTVTAGYTLALRPARVSEIRVDIQVPEGVPAERRDALLAVASHCTVHNSIVDAPDVSVALAAPVPVA